MEHWINMRCHSAPLLEAKAIFVDKHSPATFVKAMLDDGRQLFLDFFHEKAPCEKMYFLFDQGRYFIFADGSDNCLHFFSDGAAPPGSGYFEVQESCWDMTFCVPYSSAVDESTAFGLLGDFLAHGLPAVVWRVGQDRESIKNLSGS